MTLSQTGHSPAKHPRILHLIRSFSPEGGGPIEGVRKLATAYAFSPPPFEVVCLDDPSESYLRQQPFPVHALGPSAGHYGRTGALAPWLEANLHRFDGAVIHGLWQYHSYGSYRVLRGRLPYLVFPHGMLDPYFRRAYPLKHLRKAVYWLAFERRVLRDARAVCFTTEIERDCSRTTFWPHQWTSAIASFGTSAPEGDPEAQRQLFRERHPELRGRRFLLFLSRIHPKKGCDLLLEAFARIAGRERDLDLVVAGPAPEHLLAALKQRAQALGIQSRVHWPGMLLGDEKWGAFRSAEAFVLPSHQENFGVAVVEALACGLPALISNKVNLWPDIVADGTGLAEDDTVEGATRLLEAFLALNPEERRRMGQKGPAAFAARYTMDRTAQVIEQLLS